MVLEKVIHLPSLYQNIVFTKKDKLCKFIFKNIIINQVIHEQATKDIAEDIEKSIEQDRLKLEEMKKREAEEHEEKEFLQHASPDQQAQQAELDKGIFISD